MKLLMDAAGIRTPGCKQGILMYNNTPMTIGGRMRQILILTALIVLTASGCHKSDSEARKHDGCDASVDSGNAGTDGDTDSDSDSDAGNDSDIDGDAGGDAAGNTDLNEGDLIWVKQAGGKAELPGSKDPGDAGYGIAVLDDGSFYVTGFFDGDATFGPGEINETLVRGIGFFIARYDPAGRLEWVRNSEPDADCKGYDIRVLPDDSVVVTGTFWNSVTFGRDESTETILTSKGWSDIFIARYNSDGTLAWAKSAGGTDEDHGTGISVLDNGSMIITGHYEETATFGEKEAAQASVTSFGSEEIFIARYSPKGNLEWARSAGGSDTDIAKGIAVFPDGSFVITGSFTNVAIFGMDDAAETHLATQGDHYCSNLFIARYNPDGTLVWAKSAQGENDSQGNGLAASQDGSTLVTGYFGEGTVFGPEESGEITLKPADDLDIFVARYNSDGTLAWVKSAGGDYDEAGNAIVLLSDDSFIVTGYFLANATFGTGEANETMLLAPAFVTDIFVAGYNPDGTLTWARNAGGPYRDDNDKTSGDRGHDLALLPDNGILVTGEFWEEAVFGKGEANETTIVSGGHGNIFIAKFLLK